MVTTSRSEDITMVVADKLSNRQYVAEGIRRELAEALSWTTLECDWSSVGVEIPYNLSFTSGELPWGYRYRIITRDGKLVFCNPAIRKDMNMILADLISKCCVTKWGNSVDGESTVNEYIPRSKKAFGR